MNLSIIPTRRAMIKHPTGRAFVFLVAPPTTVAADHYRYTITAYMAWMTTITANDVSKRASHHFWFWKLPLDALTGHMTRYIADVAYRIVGAIAGKVASFAAVVASLIIGAINSNVAWFVAVVT